MSSKRKNLGGLLKALSLLASLALASVLVQSLFPGMGSNEENKNNHESRDVEINLEGMQVGEIRKVRWKGREAAVLKRKRPVYSESQAGQTKADILDPKSRSLLSEYFVYFNSGDSGSCPLFYDGNDFKDICSGRRFDNAGREKGGMDGIEIEIPPHHFSFNKGKPERLVIGNW